MSWYRDSIHKTPTWARPQKYGIATLSMLFALLSACRGTVSEVFVATCTVTPETLKANSCADIRKKPGCLLRLNDYTATEDTLKAADQDLKMFMGNTAAYNTMLQNTKDTLSPTEALSIIYYTGPGFRYINQGLRGDIDLLMEHEYIIYAAASGLKKLEKFKGPVFRTENLDISMLGSIQETFRTGNIVVEEVFLSTSSRSDFVFVSPSDGLHISYEIQSKTGRKVDMVSRLAEENEVLFPPGSAFRIVSYKEELIQSPSPSTRAPATQLKIELEEIEL